MKTSKESVEALARRVSELRLAMGLRQEDIARRSGIPLPTYRIFERTGRLTIERLASVLNVFGRQRELDAILTQPHVDFDTVWNETRPKKRLRARRKTTA